ncbi:MAG: 5'-nucleotidase C-terminal domain-containing protein, partial [bacterium]
QLMETCAQYDEGHYSGMNLVEMASKVEGIDVMFGGHIHVGYHRPWEDPETHVLVFQNYAKGTGIGGVKFLFDQDSKVFLGYEPIGLNDALATLFADEFWPDKDIAELVDSLQFEAEKGLAEIIAQSTGALPRGDATSNKVGHIVCDAMLDATSADVSITNMGGVRAELPGGSITRADVFAVMPFDNKVVSVPLSGQEVVEVIERMAGKYGSALIGGVEVVYNSTKGSIHSLKIGGEPVDSSATYDFATTDYVYYSYGVPQLEAVDKSKVKYTGVLLRDAIERWLTNNSPVSPDVDGRWKYIEEE